MKKISVYILSSVMTVFLMTPLSLRCEASELSDSYYNKGKIYFKQENYQAAVDEFINAINADKNDSEYYNSLGEAYVEIGNYDEAIKAHNKAISLNKQNGRYYGSRGVAYFFKGDYVKAMDDYNKAIAKDSNNPEHYCNRGAIYYYQKNYTLAKADYLKALDLKKDHLDSLINMAELALAEGNDQEVIYYYTKVLGINPDFTQGYNNRACAYSRLGRYQEALEDMKAAIESDKNRYILYVNYAQACIDLQKYQEAIDKLNKAIELEEKNHKGYLLRAMAEMNLKQYDQAFNDIAISQKYAPDKSFYDWYRGNIYQKLKRYDLALKYFGYAMNDPEIAALAYLFSADIYLEQKDIQQAQDYYNKTIELCKISTASDSSLYRQLYALAYCRISNIQLGDYEYEMALASLKEAAKVEELDFALKQLLARNINRVQKLIENNKKLEQLLDENRFGHSNEAGREEQIKNLMGSQEVLTKEINTDLQSVIEKGISAKILPMNYDPNRDRQGTINITFDSGTILR